MRNAIDYAVVSAKNETLSVRRDRYLAEQAFLAWTCAGAINHPVSLVAVHSDKTETVIAIGFADGKGE